MTVPFGHLFHGKLGEKDVLVKTWDPKLLSSALQAFDISRIVDELCFLRNPTLKSHPNVVNLIGFSCDKRLAVIYEATRPKCLLSDIIESDELGWEDRLKVAYDIATVLKSFHDSSIVHRGLRPECFLIYEDSSVMSYEFNFDYYNIMWRQMYSCEPPTAYGLDDGFEGPDLSRKEDIFGFGVLLVQIVSKIDDQYEAYRRWVKYIFRSHPSPIQESFALEEDISWEIKNLILGCIRTKHEYAHIKSDEAQLSMDDVVDILWKLITHENGLTLCGRL